MAKKIFLASSSPRRIEILRELKFNFEVVPYKFKEEYKTFTEDPVYLACTLAQKKLKSVLFDLNEEGIGLSADTIVFYDGKVFGKPEDKEEAKKILTILSENTHYVITAINMKNTITGREILSYSTTKVTFSKIDDEMMEWYLNTNEWKGKAGGYAIQGKASIFVEGIEGCFYNVVGFPINLFIRMIKHMGFSFFDFKKDEG